MRIVLQRVSRARVAIDNRVAGEIGHGFLLLAGFAPEDDGQALGWMADKIVGLRLFADEDGRMNLPLEAVDGGILVVSQFTLYGDVRKGRRPSFVKAADPEAAEALYNTFVAMLRERAPGPVETGEFGAMMDVELVNDGPVTLVIDH